MASSPSSRIRPKDELASPLLSLRPLAVTFSFGLAAVLGWVIVLEGRGAVMGTSRPMGATTAMGTGGVVVDAFLVVWMAMVLAMMLPTILPMFVTYRSLVRDRPARTRRMLTSAFLAPYAVLWAAAGTGALGLWSVGRSHPVFAGGLVVIAGLYQLGAIKSRCLRWCRSPLGFLIRFGGDARTARGALSLGTRHAAICVGCCAGLMVGLTGAGVMSISWLFALGLLMMLEKSHRAGRSLSKISGVLLLALGGATAFVPLSRLTSEATGVLAIVALTVLVLVTSGEDRKHENVRNPHAGVMP